MIVLIIQVGGQYCNADNIADIEQKILRNDTRIKQCEEIKKQLHITANTIRKQEFYDKDFVNLLSEKWKSQDILQSTLHDENIELKEELNRIKATSTNLNYIGDFKITHYCVCSKCCGKSPTNPTYGITATGTLATAGRTIAVDPRKIPYGSKVVIDGHTYIAEDCGGLIKGNKIDICVSSHTEAYQKGIRNDVPVYLIEE